MSIKIKPNKVQRTTYLKRMQQCVNISVKDPETGHARADNILCDLLHELGYEDIVEEYIKVDKWYA